MKRVIFLFVLNLFVQNTLYGQLKFQDYLHKTRISIDSSVYEIQNEQDKYLNDKETLRTGIAVGLENVENYRIGNIGQYVDGSCVEFVDEVHGIIQGKQANDDVIYTAVRAAFTKEELVAHPDWPIWVFVAVDNQGWILETSVVYLIHPDYVIQPEQMDTLMANIRNGLRFTLHAEKAARFNWFEGQILIRLGNYIEDRDVRPSIPSVFPIGSGSGVILRP